MNIDNLDIHNLKSVALDGSATYLDVWGGAKGRAMEGGNGVGVYIAN